MKLVAELLQTSVDSEAEPNLEADMVDTDMDESTGVASFIVPPVQDACTQTSAAPKMKSAAVSVRVKGKDKGIVIKIDTCSIYICII